MRNRIAIEHAWILDVTPHAEGMQIWFKLPSGNTVTAIYTYLPSFYVVLKTAQYQKGQTVPIDDQYTDFAKRLADIDFIGEVKVVKRRISAENTFFSSCLKIVPQSPLKFKKTIRFLRSLEIFEIFNSDIPLVQIFFYETGLFPFASCNLTLISRKDAFYVSKISLMDSNETISYELPPLKIIWLDISTNSAGISRNENDALIQCELTIDPDSRSLDLSMMFPPDMIYVDSHGYPQIRINEGQEFDTLQSLEVAVRKLDPDIIFTTKGDEKIFPYLLKRLEKNKLAGSFSLSRNHVPLNQSKFELGGASSYMSYGQIFHRANMQFYLQGRLHIDSAIMGGLHFSDGNLYGIVEVARISYITLQRLTRVTIGGALQSMQFFHAFAQGILIPEEKKNVEFFQEAENLLKSDRGGHILNPKVGMFDKVAELDFTSMYPSLMVKYNVSPEKLNCKCCNPSENPVPGLPYHICNHGEGIVPLSLRLPLMKRIRYKELKNHASLKEKKRLEQMQTALKWILVVCFGYLGFRNARFGRIEAHQTVCAYSREFLLNAIDIVESHGIRYLHGIVDSIYVQAPPTMDLETFHAECQAAVSEITRKTQIPINYNPSSDYFDFITFLPTKAEPDVGALNRYWGVKPNGKIKVRGLELRRHDSPPLVKSFQHSVITAISTSKYRLDTRNLMQKTILPLVSEYFEKLDAEQVSEDELAITIRLTRHPDEYKVNNYQAIAARHLLQHGLYLGPGQKISFIITNDKAENPMEKSLPLQIYRKSEASYDIIKYRELIIRALNNLLPNPLSQTKIIDFAHNFPNAVMIEEKTQKSILEYI